MELDFKGDLAELVRLPNIAEEMSDSDLQKIGELCWHGHHEDLESRSEWEAVYATSMKLALQITEQKSYPWPNASNVKFPLISISAINFHSNAYPGLIDPVELVKGKILGEDSDGKRLDSATRVGAHMSYLLLEEDSDWEASVDRELLMVPIIGCAFRKTYFSRARMRPLSELVLPGDLVVNYYTTDLRTSPRIGHRIPFSQNEVLSRIREGIWVDQDYSSAFTGTEINSAIQEAKDEGQNTHAPFNTTTRPGNFVEQQYTLDLDGDGYAEPYIITFNEVTGRVARIQADFYSSTITRNAKKEVVRILRIDRWTKIPFIPSPDGGFYDIGFGMLLGPLNASVDTALNQLIDQGTMYSLGGGFLGRGVRIKGGNYQFKPHEWKRVESSGSDLQKDIYPLPVREPSQVLLALVQFLVSYSERLAGATEAQMGEMPGSGQKTGAMTIVDANGRRIFKGIFKRIWRARKEEFRKVFDVIDLHYDDIMVGTDSSWFKVSHDDYKVGRTGVVPAADPDVVSAAERMQNAAMVVSTMGVIPGHNPYEVGKNLYKAAKIQGWEVMLPDPKGPDAIPQGPDVKMIEAQAKMLLAQSKQLEVQNSHLQVILQLSQEAELVSAKVLQLQSDAILKLKQSKGIDMDGEIALVNQEIDVSKLRLDWIKQVIDTIQGASSGSTGSTGSTGAGDGTGSNAGSEVQTMAGAPAIGNLSLTPPTPSPGGGRTLV